MYWPAHHPKRSPGVVLTTSSASCSDDGILPVSHRSMRAMNVFARSLEPEVTLQLSEVLAIIAVHQSDANLSLSLHPVTEPDVHPAA